eukprot:TRINITY_DN29615_c0_g1_i2.p1 TRINITY_DN29615_c0_g1~~TRINITY_DN29615_c0_g1_i2.p1  ORF type:complete len:216 (+),score=56.27 TRINITY_DN29615_c0_g1_i2:123-770(+)
MCIRDRLQVAQDYNVELDFLPFGLDFVSMGITKEHTSDNKRIPPSKHADLRARMFYATAREYARLQKLPFRPPAALLRSRVANLGLLYARDAGVAAEFIGRVFEAGWPNGFREYDMESVEALQGSLANAQHPRPEGFAAFLSSGEGETRLEQVAEQARASGLVGVPHYELVLGEERFGLFGREHLSLVRLKLHQAGLARRADVNPHISHAWESSL